MSKKRIKIGIIGAGSIGSLFGGYLSLLNTNIYCTEIIFFCRKSHADEINGNGLILQKGQTELKINKIKAFKNWEEFKDFIIKESKFTFDFIFLTTKTYDIETAVAEYHELIKASKWLVILQNGIGNEEIVSKYCIKKKIIRIVTTNGALLDKPGHVIHTGIGITKIGFAFQKDLNLNDMELKEAQLDLRVLGDLLNLASLETIIVDDIIKECWEKIFVNVGINAFGALTHLTNGKLLENEGIKRLMGEAVNEAFRVAEMKRINLSKKDFISLTYDVAEKTSENINSMLQDILKGKNTEIDFINGRIVKLAKGLGVDTPINEFLTYLIKGLEQSSI